MREGECQLRWLNAYRVAATASACVFPETVDDLYALGTQYQDAFTLGQGNNVILSKTHYAGSNRLISMSRFDSAISVQGNRVYAAAGASLRRVCISAALQGLSGLERLWDIPSSVGGAIYMNAGAYDSDIHRLIQNVRVFDRERRRVRSFERSDLLSGYRSSIFQGRPWIIIGAQWELIPSSASLVWKAMREVSTVRRRNFPYNLPNAGSVFKRPSIGPAVGHMVERLGLKGTAYGGARISELHGGFIVTDGAAVGADIIGLSEIIRANVERSYGTRLVMEQVVV